MKNIITLKYGDKYSSQDVNTIYKKTNADSFYCFTDNPSGLERGIEAVPLDSEIEGHWEKVKILGSGIENALYLDLDIVIQKPLDYLWDCDLSKPKIIYCFWKPEWFPEHKDERWSYNYLSLYNSSMIMWDDASHIYDYFMKDPDYFMVKYAGDDRFLHHEGFDFNFFTEDDVYSFMFSRKGYQPDKTVCLLNGQDKFKDLRKQYDDAVSLHKVGQ